MKKKLFNPSHSLLFSLFGVGLAFLSQVLVVLFCLPKSAIYYEGAPLLHILPVVPAALAILPPLLWSLYKKPKSPSLGLAKVSCYPQLLRIPALIPAAVAGLFLLQSSMFAALTYPLVIITLLGCCYPLFSAFPKLRQYKLLITLPGLCAVLCPLLLTTVFYFDSTAEMNAPLKVYLMIAMAALPLLPLYEMKQMHEEDAPSPLLLPVQLLVLSLGALSAPTILAFFLKDYPHGFVTLATLTPIGYSASVLWSLLSTPKADSPSTSPAPNLTEEPERKNT